MISRVSLVPWSVPSANMSSCISRYTAIVEHRVSHPIVDQAHTRVLTVVAPLDPDKPAKLPLYEDPDLFALGFDISPEMFHSIAKILE